MSCDILIIFVIPNNPCSNFRTKSTKSNFLFSLCNTSLLDSSIKNDGIYYIVKYREKVAESSMTSSHYSELKATSVLEGFLCYTLQPSPVVKMQNPSKDR